MSRDTQACQHPEKLQGRQPGECTPEQIRECHGKETNLTNESADGTKAKVEAVLAKIRPSLQADGGDVVLLGIKDGTVMVKLTGHCAGCPMSTMTLKNGIERMLKQEIPEVKQVVAS